MVGPSPDVMALADLAARWSVDPDALAKRLRKLALPAVNVGTKSQPDYRFRLPAIERWELANEITLGADLPEQGSPVPTAAPNRTIEVYDPYSPVGPNGPRTAAARKAAK